MKITDLRATTVAVPLEAPLRHANGCHWGRFVRTIVEVETDTGLIGLGEMGGGGESAVAGIRALKAYLVGRDPAQLEEMRFLLANPTASLYNNRTQMLAAIEFACLDLLGQAWGVSVCDILGGRVRDRVTFASYLFFRYAAGDGAGTIRTIDQVVEFARAAKAVHGFTTHKMKGGVFHPDYELECYRAVAAAFPGDRVRFDPNGVWSTEQAIRFGRAIESLDNDYLEDPVFGLAGMRSAREKLRVPLATNTVVVNFEQLAANVLQRAVDVILLDTTFWGGIRPCVKAAGVCETFQLGVAVHSSGELGIQLATMLHLGAVVPNLSFAADAHYHHLKDDVIEGGKLVYENGAIRVPDGPGLGVRLDRTKLAQYEELYRELGPYPYDQDPARPGWTPLVPNDRWADPADGREPFLVRGSAFARRSGMKNVSGGDMATRDTTAGGDNSDSTIEQSSQAVGSLIESGATMVGRGLAAGVEGMAQLAERAAQMTGLTSPRAIGNAAESATRATMTAARSAARTTRSVARSSATAASRSAGSATRAVARTARPMAKPTQKRSAKPAAKRSTKRSARPAMKASAQKGRRKVSRSTSMQSKRTGAKSGRTRKRS